MTPQIKMTIIGDTQVFARIDEINKRVNDLTIPFKKAINVMLRSIDQNFTNSGRPYPWRPLKLSTLKWKLKHGYSLRPLIRTGALRRSIVGEAQPKKLTIGTAVGYAPYHQRGTGSIPQRKFLLFQDKDIKNISKLVSDYVTGK